MDIYYRSPLAIFFFFYRFVSLFAYVVVINVVAASIGIRERNIAHRHTFLAGPANYYLRWKTPRRSRCNSLGIGTLENLLHVFCYPSSLLPPHVPLSSPRLTILPIWSGGSKTTMTVIIPHSSKCTTCISRAAIVVKVPPIAMSLTTITLSPFSSSRINGHRDNLAISGVAVLDMSLAIPLASKNLLAGATLPFMTHSRPPFASDVVDLHLLLPPFLALVTFFNLF